MLLAALPVEAFSIITAYLHHLDFKNLFLTGSRVINAKVAKGVTELRIVYNAYFDPSPWPPSLYHFVNLQYLLICNEEVNSLSTVPYQYLQAASSTLREMNLHGEQLYRAFLSSQYLQPPAGASYPMLEVLTISCAKTDTPTSSPMWPKSITGLYTSGLFVDTLKLSSLPPNLTALSGQYKTLGKHAVTEFFPKSMTILDLRFWHFLHFYEVIPLLPIGLKTLSLSIPNSCRLLQHQQVELTKCAIPLLPPHLTKLQWPIRTEHDREMLLALPRTLTWLENASVESKDFDALPRSLTYCDAFDHFNGPLLRKESFPSLPPYLNLVCLSLSDVENFHPEVNLSVIAVPHLVHRSMYSEPPRTWKALSHRITGMSFRRMATLPPGLVEALPQSLRTLELISGSLTSRQVSLLPWSLRDLELVDGAFLGDFEVRAHLPPFLTRLALHSVKTLHKDSSLWLPPTLRSLKLYSTASVPVSWFAGLPEGLQELEFSFVLKSTKSLKMHFPPNLLRLSFDVSFDLNEEVSANTTSTLVPNMICALPPSLEEFNLCNRSYNRVYLRYSISDLARLPSRLRRLNMPHVVLRRACVLPILPKSLLSTCTAHWCVKRDPSS